MIKISNLKIKFEENIKYGKKVKFDQNIKIEKNVKFDQNIKIENNVNINYILHLPHLLPTFGFGISFFLDQNEILGNQKETGLALIL